MKGFASGRGHSVQVACVPQRGGCYRCQEAGSGTFMLFVGNNSEPGGHNF